jgi:hypothetical protein
MLQLQIPGEKTMNHGAFGAASDPPEKISRPEHFSLKINKQEIFRIAETSKNIFRQSHQGLFFDCHVRIKALFFKALGNSVSDVNLTCTLRLPATYEHTRAQGLHVFAHVF